MRIFTFILTGAAMLALAACGKSEDKAVGANQSAADVAAKIRKVSLEPGEWETTSEVVDIAMDNAPAGMPAGVMDSMKGRKTVVKTCITPEQAEKPDADLLTAQKNSKCTYNGFEMAGGTIKGTISCPGEQGGTTNVALDGIYTPASYAVTMQMETAGMGGPSANGMAMHMKVKTSGKRLGSCPK